MSRCHRLTPYVEVIPQMANKYNHLAICLACVGLNNCVYTVVYKFTNTKKCCKTHFKKCKFFKEKHGKDALTIIYENDDEQYQNQS